MTPIDERKEYNLTSTQNEKVKEDIEKLLSSFDDLEYSKYDFYQNAINVIKPRKKNTHLTPKKKKRK